MRTDDQSRWSEGRLVSAKGPALARPEIEHKAVTCRLDAFAGADEQVARNPRSAPLAAGPGPVAGAPLTSFSNSSASIVPSLRHGEVLRVGGYSYHDINYESPEDVTVPPADDARRPHVPAAAAGR